MIAEDLKAIGDLMDLKLAPVIQRLDSIEDRLDSLEDRLDSLEDRLDSLEDRLGSLEESNEEVRNGVNSLIGWAEKVSMAATFPLPDIDG